MCNIHKLYIVIHYDSNTTKTNILGTYHTLVLLQRQLIATADLISTGYNPENWKLQLTSNGIYLSSYFGTFDEMKNENQGPFYHADKFCSLKINHWQSKFIVIYHSEISCFTVCCFIFAPQRN